MLIRILKFTTLASLVTGMILLFLSTDDSFEAKLSSQGSTVLEQPLQELSLKQGAYHTAAFDRTLSTSGKELLLGILLIVLGFGIHMLVTLRSDQNVRIRDLTGKLKKSKKQQGFYRYKEWLWIDIR